MTSAISRQIKSVLIVGAGLTGSVTAAGLRCKHLDIALWEKSRGSGGRMSTSRSPLGNSSSVDTGAQYISASPPEFTKYEIYFKELIEENIIEPLKGLLQGDKRDTNGTKDFIATMGINTVVKHYLNNSGASVSFNQRVKHIACEGKAWKVTSENGHSQIFDAIILTIPTPQILELQGDIKQILERQPDVLKKLSDVRFSSRFAAGLFYKPETKINVPWCGKYFDDDCVRFVAIDSKKRNIESDQVGPSVVVHTGVPFGIEHIEEDMADVCNKIVLPRLAKLVPELPNPDSVKPHKWRYSQVFTAYDGQPGAVMLQNEPLIICAGDAFTKSGFVGCLESTEKVLQLFEECSKL